MRRTEINQLGDPALLKRLTAILRGIDSLNGIAAPLVAKLAGLGTLVELEPGEVLIHEGDQATPEIYMLLEGALVVQSKAGFIARLDQPGDIAGEVAVLMSSRRTADVVAESAVRALAFQPEILKRPEFADVSAVFHRIVSRSVSNKLSDDWVKY
jgi:CRP-like cAMP-binding protein